MGIPLKRGRLLGAEDRPGGPQAVLISESFAARRFAGRDTIGEQVRMGPYLIPTDLPGGTIVGVVGDVKQASLASTSPPDAFYVAMGQWAWVDDVQSLAVRTEGDPASLVRRIKDAVWSVDPTLPLVRITTMGDLVAASEAQRTFALTVFAAFGLAALLLAGVGVYGVIEQRVTERTREIGLRSALGATPRRLAAFVVWQGLTLTIVGAVIGIGAAVGSTRAIATLLFGIQPFDLVTYAGVVALLLAVAFIACYAPAFRARASIPPSPCARTESPMSLAPSDFGAVRLLAKRPWFTALTVAMLAGGLSITLYTFTVLHVMLYRDLPLPDGSSIVKIGAGSWVDIELLDAFELAELRAGANSLSELGVYRTSRSLVGESGATRSVRSVESDWRIFEFTRTPPLLGRGFVADDNSAAAEPVAVLGYETWQNVFSGDAAVVGELVRINGRLTRVVGVMPLGYAFPETAELWLPLGPKDLAPAGYTDRGLQTYARLRPGVSVETAQTELTSLVERVREQRPATSKRSPIRSRS
jgi:hypothetical protein